MSDTVEHHAKKAPNAKFRNGSKKSSSSSGTAAVNSSANELKQKISTLTDIFPDWTYQDFIAIKDEISNVEVQDIVEGIFTGKIQKWDQVSNKKEEKKKSADQDQEHQHQQHPQPSSTAPAFSRHGSHWEEAGHGQQAQQSKRFQNNNAPNKFARSKPSKAQQPSSRANRNASAATHSTTESTRETQQSSGSTSSSSWASMLKPSTKPIHNTNDAITSQQNAATEAAADGVPELEAHADVAEPDREEPKQDEEQESSSPSADYSSSSASAPAKPLSWAAMLKPKVEAKVAESKQTETSLEEQAEEQAAAEEFVEEIIETVEEIMEETEAAAEVAADVIAEAVEEIVEEAIAEAEEAGVPVEENIESAKAQLQNLSLEGKEAQASVEQTEQQQQVQQGQPQEQEQQEQQEQEQQQQQSNNNQRQNNYKSNHKNNNLNNQNQNQNQNQTNNANANANAYNNGNFNNFDINSFMRTQYDPNQLAAQYGGYMYPQQPMDAMMQQGYPSSFNPVGATPDVTLGASPVASATLPNMGNPNAAFNPMMSVPQYLPYYYMMQPQFAQQSPYGQAQQSPYGQAQMPYGQPQTMVPQAAAAAASSQAPNQAQPTQQQAFNSFQNNNANKIYGQYGQNAYQGAPQGQTSASNATEKDTTQQSQSSAQAQTPSNAQYSNQYQQYSNYNNANRYSQYDQYGNNGYNSQFNSFGNAGGNGSAAAAGHQGGPATGAAPGAPVAASANPQQAAAGGNPGMMNGMGGNYYQGQFPVAGSNGQDGTDGSWYQKM